MGVRSFFRRFFPKEEVLDLTEHGFALCGPLNVIASGVKTATQVNAIGQQAQFQLAEDQENVLLAKHAQQDAVARGAEAEAATRLEGTQLADKQAFLYANSGIDASVGTAANVVNATRVESERNALVVRNNAAREAWGHGKTVTKLKRQKDVNLARSGEQVNSTILGGIADAASAGSKG